MFQFMFMVQLLVKFRFFIEELWERKSLQILYECWRRAYHALLAQLFIYFKKTIIILFQPGEKNLEEKLMDFLKHKPDIQIRILMYEVSIIFNV
jgi:hypothetical protein